MTYEMALLDRELKGREEARTATILEMVKNFLVVGAPIDFIAKATGWSEKKILQLKNDDHDDSDD